ncbi:speckle-type POZ protein-like B [Trichonephila inaurata madagascariensis]|uniref:Speckle-type POZ protein-like B n=1 Tax=Trichonephila inaurata madagascariensis TaxID=2747483 RepID=A0A8X6YNN8_9ARAC|nr:speckle-type POZ protein-like B [Trichonephila inaurata madagascariensis]
MFRADRIFNEKGQIIWSKVLSPEWTIICVCSQNKPFMIDCIEIHRQSVAEEFLITGTLHLYGDKKHIAKKKILQSLESGTSLIGMELIYSYSNAKSPEMFSLEGDIAIHETQINSVIDFVSMEDATRSESLFELSDDFGHLLKIQSLSDVDIKCGGIIIPAHKSILSARSPIFATMIHNNQMREVIEMDIDASVLKIMLLHMYTGKMGYSTVSQALDVLVAADKYQLFGLKKACCNFLKEMVSIDNSIQILTVGYMVAPDLKGFVMDFLCKKCEFSVLQESEHWKMLERTHCSLSLEVLTTVVRDREQKMKACKY